MCARERTAGQRARFAALHRPCQQSHTYQGTTNGKLPTPRKSRLAKQTCLSAPHTRAICDLLWNVTGHAWPAEKGVCNAMCMAGQTRAFPALHAGYVTALYPPSTMPHSREESMNSVG